MTISNRGFMTEKLCTIREASEILAVTEGTIRGWIQVGRLPVIRLGRAVRLKSGLLDQIQEEGLYSIQQGSDREGNQLLERLSGLNTLLGKLDDVLEIIRSSGYRYEARDRLMDRYGLNMKQVVAFLDMNIGKLTGMEQERIRVEYLTEEEEK